MAVISQNCKITNVIIGFVQLKKSVKNKKPLRTKLTSENGVSRKVEKEKEHPGVLIVLVNFKKYVNQYEKQYCFL